MFFRKTRPQSRGRMRQEDARPGPVFCISLALPLPLRGRSADPAPSQGTPTLHLAFCSAGARAPGWGWQADLSVPAAGDQGAPQGRRRLSAIGWMAETLATGFEGWPAMLALREREQAAEVAMAPPGATSGEGARGPMPGGAAGVTPDRFAVAMQEWPIPLIAWSGRQAAFVGIMHFCDVIPGLPVPRHRTLPPRLGSADARPRQWRLTRGESTVRKRPR